MSGAIGAPHAGPPPQNDMKLVSATLGARGGGSTPGRRGTPPRSAAIARTHCSAASGRLGAGSQLLVYTPPVWAACLVVYQRTLISVPTFDSENSSAMCSL